MDAGEPSPFETLVNRKTPHEVVDVKYDIDKLKSGWAGGTLTSLQQYDKSVSGRITPVAVTEDAEPVTVETEVQD